MAFHQHSFILIGEKGEYNRGEGGHIWHWERKAEAEEYTDSYWKVIQNCQSNFATEFSEELKNLWKNIV